MPSIALLQYHACRAPCTTVRLDKAKVFKVWKPQLELQASQAWALTTAQMSTQLSWSRVPIVVIVLQVLSCLLPPEARAT